MTAREVPLTEALGFLVDSLMESYELDPKKQAELRSLLLHVSTATATLLCNHFEKQLPGSTRPPPPAFPKPPEPLAADVLANIPWGKGGSHVN